MNKILVDTCVWLDLAKDHEQHLLLNVLEELIQRKELSLLVPVILIDEFQRNKIRVVQDIGKSLSGNFKRVKDAVSHHGDPKKKQVVLDQLNDIDYKIPFLGESAEAIVSRIEKLLTTAEIIEISNDVKLRAADRAIEKKAPFHRSKNSMNDAILIETYWDCVQNKNSVGNRFLFVTHNTKDFSNSEGNDKAPHGDFVDYFSKRKI